MTEVLHNDVVLFVGYGLRDEHVRRLLSKLRRVRGQWARKAYAVGFYDEVRSRLLASRGIETIDADAAEFLPELARRAGATLIGKWAGRSSGIDAPPPDCAFGLKRM